MILISRFLIDLRQADRPDASRAPSSFSRFSTPNFHVPTLATIMEDMGELLGHGSHASEDESEEDFASVELESEHSKAISKTEDGDMHEVSVTLSWRTHATNLSRGAESQVV